MAYLISEACVNCGACIDECPVSCIFNVDNHRVIDDSVCINCEACVNVCAVNAIQPVE